MMSVSRSNTPRKLTMGIKSSQRGGLPEAQPGSYALKSPSVTTGYRSMPVMNARKTAAAEEARDSVSDDEYGEMLNRAKNAL